MKRTYIYCLICVLLLTLSFSSCKKYLDKKPDKQLVIPSTLQDLQYLLDDYSLNTFFTGAAELLSDNYYLTFADWQSIGTNARRDYYVWHKNDNNIGDWTSSYTSVYKANIILDHLDDIKYSPNEQTKWNEIKGSALFLRSYYFYHIAQLFSQPYDKYTASTDLGIPIRLTPDFNVGSTRATVKEVYDQITNDLQVAVELLPALPTYKNRPCKAAAYAALARTYLTMLDYDNAGSNAANSLKIKSNLIDFSTLDLGSPDPLNEFTPETIFHARTGVYFLQNSRFKIDSTLFQSYNSRDLRKVVFFESNNDGTYRQKSNYSGYGSIGYHFAGLATNEMYLIKAECDARKGRINDALESINTLLSKRWETGSFDQITTTDSKELTQLILNERRKELVSTITRWSDLKRLNKETQYRVPVKRILNGQVYILEPNSAGYTVQIPKDIIDKAGIPQNP